MQENQTLLHAHSKGADQSVHSCSLINKNQFWLNLPTSLEISKNQDGLRLTPTGSAPNILCPFSEKTKKFYPLPASIGLDKHNFERKCVNIFLPIGLNICFEYP